MRKLTAAAFVVGIVLGAVAPGAAGPRADVLAQDKGKPKGKAPEPPTAEREFLEGYASEDPVVRAKAVERLVDVPEPARLQLIASKVVPKEKRADIVARTIEVLGRIQDESVCEKVVSLARVGSVEQRVVYVEALASMRVSSAAHRALLELVNDKETWIRAMAAYGLGEHRAADAIAPLVACLDDRQWQVQSAALGALPRIQDKEALKTKAVPELIRFLDLSSGRQQADCADALKRILGRNLGKDPDAWRRFLAGGDGAAPAAPGAPGGEDGQKPAPGSNAAYGSADKPHFYGIEVTSTRVVIVLDTSLSMNDPIEIDKERLRRETSKRRAVTGEGPADAPKDADPADVGYDIPWWRIKSRLDLARYQTIHLISQLQQEQNFDLILFNTKVDPWMGKLVPATQANKQKAIAMVEALKPDGETNTWGALSAAFELSASNVRTGGPGSPDEIYFVTDGAPSKGDIIDGNQIYEAAIQLAKVHQMRIHVIGIGVNLTFLRKMAVMTGGQAKFFE
jgi:hypothetical protein